MKIQSIDTDDRAERVFIALIRSQNFSRKLFQTLSLSKAAIQLSKRAILRANKNLGVDQIKLLFVNYHYGKNLAKKVKQYIDKGYDIKS